VTAVHQFVPTLVPGDAVGHHVLELQTLLRALGVDSEVFAAEIDPELAGAAHPYDEFTGDPGATLLYHASTASPVAAFLAGRPEPKVVDYHNVTPPEFFTGWDPPQATRLRAARREIATIARDAALVITHSHFSARDVDGWGRADAMVLPVLGASFLAGAPGPPARAARAGTSEATWLFVGRCAPNKAQHRLIEALVIHRRSYGGRVRLRLVGAASPLAYRDALERLAAAAGVADAVEFHDSVPAATLASWYREADVFVSASAHEGFCVPVLEAMRFGLPVVARAAGAVPETAGGAAVLVPGDSASTLAVAAERVHADPALADRLATAGRARVETVLGGGHDAYRAAFASYLGRAA
jgi:glycosyltransferase involved in cell wall biosynthesis